MLFGQHRVCLFAGRLHGFKIQLGLHDGIVNNALRSVDVHFSLRHFLVWAKEQIKVSCFYSGSILSAVATKLIRPITLHLWGSLLNDHKLLEHVGECYAAISWLLTLYQALQQGAYSYFQYPFTLVY